MAISTSERDRIYGRCHTPSLDWSDGQVLEQGGAVRIRPFLAAPTCEGLRNVPVSGSEHPQWPPLEIV